ncbi:MAG: hypothetical protein ABJG78_15425 [Cyclobacteriaceae bacterium]
MEAKTKARPKAKKTLSDQKNKVAREIKSKQAELDMLNSKIGDLKKLADKKDVLQKEVDELTQKKLELGKLTIQQQSVSREVKDLNDEKKKISSFLKNNKPKKETLAAELSKLESTKDDLKGKVELFQKSSEKAQTTIAQLKEEKENYDLEIANLKSEYGLIPRDLKELSKDSMLQLKKYAKLATITAIGGLVMMGLLVLLLVQPIVDSIFSNTFQDDNLTFYTILSTKTLLFVTFIFFIHVLFNLTKGFVSQYVKTRNRLTTLRVADYLIDQANTVSGSNGKAKVDLLHDYLPKIMEMDSFFRVSSKT